ncbi:hypothetical protein ACJJIX_00965 [Microbulbifer sp. VAAC004]|uniref:hypothetical protein n=1 Tax=unclassified Microbulbifer TaxID=2619833 RepID=UPI00403A6C65
MTSGFFIRLGFFFIFAVIVVANSVAETIEEKRSRAEKLIQRLENKYLSNEVPAILQKLEKNELSMSVINAFALEQRLIIQSDLRNNALSLHRFGDSSSKVSNKFFYRLVVNEMSASEQLPALIQALNISESQIARYRPLAGAQAYPAYTTWLANYAQPAEIAAALLINFQSFGKNVGRMAKALKQHRGLSDSQLEFLINFSTLPSDFREQAIAIVAQGLASGVSESDIETRVRLIQAYESNFWSALSSIDRK